MINFGAFLNTLPMMGAGMLGIFIVMIIIALIVTVQNKAG